MKIFRVKRTDPVGWCEDYECIVCAADKMWAEKIARESSDDFRKARLKVSEINMNNEGVLLTANTGG